MKLLILQGIPASGKTTYSREFMKTHSKDWVRISMDDLREMCGDYWVPSREGLIFGMEDVLIREALESEYNVILDDTNLNKKRLSWINRIAKEYQAEVEIKRFDISLEEAIQRDIDRGSKVGIEVLENFYNKYINVK